MAIYPRFIKHQPSFNGLEFADIISIAVVLVVCTIMGVSGGWSLISILVLTIIRKVMSKVFDMQGVYLYLLHGRRKHSWFEQIRRIMQ